MAGMGLALLADWFTHIPSATQVLLRLSPMTRNAAACFLLCALAFLIIVLGGARWLPLSVAMAVATSTVALWQALLVAWHAPFSLLSGVVLGGGCVLAPSFGLTVYLAQRAHAQAAALRRNEAFLAEAQHISATGSFLWRVATDEATCSAEIYRIFELDHDREITPALVRTLVHPDDRRLFDETISRARRTGSGFDLRHRLLMPDRSIKHLHVVARAIRSDGGEPEYIGAVQDVTESRVSEESLDMARTELAYVARVMSLGALTASIAHEVSQPLSGIITNAGTCLRTLSTDPPDIEGARETARCTIRDGNRASEVITRLRALFVRNATTSESVDLNEMTREVLALSRSELQRNRVTLLAELADDLPAVSGDRVQLQQVILNLLLNAVEAMDSIYDRTRHLVISTTAEANERVCLTVQDAGVGLRPEAMDRLFEAFYTTKGSGMGIGLSVSRTIIERHRGHLWATPNDGPGASFSFSLPRAREVVPGARAGQLPAGADTARPLEIA